MALSRRAFLSGLAGVAGSAALAAVVLEQGRDGSSPASSPTTGAGPTSRRTTAPATTTAGAPATSSLPAAGTLAAGTGTLVLVTLYGGNDGLNTVVPVGDPAYAKLRGDLAVDPTRTLPLADGLAFAPEMAGFKRLWDAGQLAVVRGVSYPNPNRSHFRSMDIWQSADPAGVTTTGWLGRWLDAAAATPLDGVAIGSTLPLVLAGERTAGAAIPIGGSVLKLPGATKDAWKAMQTPAKGDSPLLARAAQSGADLLTVEATVGPVLDGAAGTNARANAGGDLGAQLDTVVRMIRAGLPTRAYVTAMGGFDTHADEGPTHPALLADLDAAVDGFFQSLAGDAHGASVVVLIHSEFGRRPSPDASGGTDHGVAAPVLVAGPAVKGGFVGDEPSLTTFDDNGDLVWNVDFRSIYASLLGDVLGADPGSVLLGASVPAFSLVRT
jgi:uncharacterized protein (DUF1501 family)